MKVLKKKNPNFARNANLLSFYFKYFSQIGACVVIGIFFFLIIKYLFKYFLKHCKSVMQ